MSKKCIIKYEDIKQCLANSSGWIEAKKKISDSYGFSVSEDIIRGVLRRSLKSEPYKAIHILKKADRIRGVGKPLNKEDIHSILELPENLITLENEIKTEESNRISLKNIQDNYYNKEILNKRIKSLKDENKQLLEQLHEAKIRSGFLDEIKNHDCPDIKIKEPKSRIREGTAVILASDWHIEEYVDPESISGRNAYSLEIAQERIKRFFTGIRWMIEQKRNSFKIRDVILWLGGDLISGYIHPELAEANEASPIEAILHLKNLISNGITYLLEDKLIEKLYIPCSYGNHGRTTEKIRIQTGAENSFEWLLYNVLKDEFKNEKRVQFIIDRSAHQYINVYDKTLHFHHGDDLRYGGGVGGISIAINKRIPIWDRFKQSEVHNIGHWHQWIPLRRCVVNGSLIGYSPYSLRIGADYEDPVQAFYIFDSKRGKVEQSQIFVID